MEDSVIWKWVANAFLVLAGGLWLGILHNKTSRNEADLGKVINEKVDHKSLESLRRSALEVTDINIRLVRVEEQSKYQIQKLEEIHAMVMEK